MENNQLIYSALVPANTTATLYLPASGVKTIRESGKPVDKASGIKFIRFEKRKAVFELQSGSYEFTSQQ